MTMLGLCKTLMRILLLCLFSHLALAEQGLFWKAESGTGKPIYLFGTIHADDNRVTDFSPLVLASLKSVDAFMMEADAPQDPTILQTKDADIKTSLSAKELDTLYALADFHVMHRNVALRTKPWLLAVIFDSAKPLTPYAQDNLLMRLAEDYGKEVQGIESASEHFSVMDALSRDQQITFLRQVLKRSAQEKARNYEHLIKAYIKGDLNKLAILNEQITGSLLPKPLWAEIRVKLLDERNVLMAERVLAKATDKSLFVAVGASHLAGKTGLIVALKNAGYTLQALH